MDGRFLGIGEDGDFESLGAATRESLHALSASVVSWASGALTSQVCF